MIIIAFQVSHMKHSDQQSLLTTTLKQEVSTRWDSICAMFDSLLRNKMKIVSIPGKVQQFLLEIDWELMKKFYDFLLNFEKIRLLLSYKNQPTSHLVVNYCMICRVDPNDPTLRVDPTSFFKNVDPNGPNSGQNSGRVDPIGSGHSGRFSDLYSTVGDMIHS